MNPLFIIGCIPTRCYLAYLTATASPRTLKSIGIGAAAVSLGFFTLYLTGWRTTGIETGGRSIWWNALRPFHAINYAAVAAAALADRRGLAADLIFADTVFGLIAFLAHYRVATL